MEETEATKSVQDRTVSVFEVRDIMKFAVNELADKLFARIENLKQQSFVDLMINISDDQYLLCVWGAMRRAIREILTSIREENDLQEAFLAAVFQVDSSAPPVQPVFKARLLEKKKMGSAANIVAYRARLGEASQ